MNALVLDSAGRGGPASGGGRPARTLVDPIHHLLLAIGNLLTDQIRGPPCALQVLGLEHHQLAHHLVDGQFGQRYVGATHLAQPLALLPVPDQHLPLDELGEAALF